MRFLHPEFLWLLSLLPLLAILRGRRSKAPALVFSSTSIAATLAEGRKTGPGRVLAALRLLGLGLLILAFARPQLGNTTTGYPYNTTYVIGYWNPSLVGQRH